MRDDDAYSLTHLGLALQREGKHREAVAAFARAAALDPDHAGLYSNLGNALADVRDLAQAEAALRHGLQLDAGDPALHNNLGFVLRRQGRLVEAAEAFRRSAELGPNAFEPRQNLGNALTLLCCFNEAIRAHREALKRWPLLGCMGGNLLYTISYHPTMSAAAIVDVFRSWGRSMWAPTPMPPAVSGDRRLRVGYVSPDFRNHTTRFYLLPLLRHLDRDAFELHAFANVQAPDAHTEEMRPLFDHWCDISDMGDQQAVEVIRAAGLDLLIDLTGHMEANRLMVFALRAAPVQATWLGSCWTTGLPAMDFAIQDVYTAPPGSDALFVEKVWRLPHTLFCFQPDTLPPPTPPPAARNGHITFGYSGRSERLNPLVFAAWGEILRRTKTARLVLDFACFGDPVTGAAFMQSLQEAGVDVARVTMRCSPGAQAALAEIDILLDSFPHSGGTMLFDAIWAGVPVVTLAARPPVGRIGACIMSNLGMSDWIADEVEGYIAIATEKAAHPDTLAVLRGSLRSGAESSALGNAEMFAQHMGQAYRDMVASMSETAATMMNERPE